jgi:hypothetical protein
VLAPQVPLHLFVIPAAGSLATAPVLSAVTVRWAGTWHVDQPGQPSHFDRWARLAALGLGLVSAHYYSFFFFFFSSKNCYSI